ncbi:MAG: response regulator [Spirochaeta sp.]|nr:response regulator [Spirochaeta sp.]
MLTGAGLRRCAGEGRRVKRRIYVIDDELPVLEGVRFIVESSFPEGEICGTCSSGLQAIEEIDHDPPDILLVDIHLPGISGLEILNDVRTRHPAVLCIIISAYEQFTIAKEALDFGVFAYIVKPVTKTKLLKVLSDACEELDRNDQRHEADLAGKALRQSVEALLERQLVPRLFSGVWRPHADEWELWLKALRSVRPDFAPAVALGFIPCADASIAAGLAAALHYKLACWTGLTDLGGVGVLLSAPRGDVSGDLREAARNALRINGAVLDQTIWCTQPVPLERVWETLPPLGSSGPADISRVDTSASPELLLRKALIKLPGLLRSGDSTALAKWREIHTPLLRQMLERDREYARVLLMEPILEVYRPPRLPPVAICELGRQSTAEDTLDLVARIIGEARTTASRLFRHELQLPFSDYLSSLRMEEAQRLLSESDLSIKEVGYAVGYQDANYFSRVFKRWVGMRPREYSSRSGVSREGESL